MFLKLPPVTRILTSHILPPSRIGGSCHCLVILADTLSESSIMASRIIKIDRLPCEILMRKALQKGLRRKKKNPTQRWRVSLFPSFSSDNQYFRASEVVMLRNKSKWSTNQGKGRSSPGQPEGLDWRFQQWELPPFVAVLFSTMNIPKRPCLRLLCSNARVRRSQHSPLPTPAATLTASPPPILASAP